MKMPKELKTKWLEALRSGKYSQGQFSLFDGTGYCCLGVLEMVCDGEVEKEYEEGHDREFPLTMPSDKWYKEHGIKDFYDDVEEKGYKTDIYLSLMNDGASPQVEGKTFPEIADWIEDNVGVTDRE